uniref:PG2 pseudoGTPase domain-containing protein n=1 Tax=Plectus sambesii TaxID=2011161 RepID=A0A914UW61_9BILA
MDDCFSREQIGRLLECASSASKVRKTSSLDEAIAAGPVDLRIELCLMCGDQFPPQAVLGPLLAEGRQQSVNVNRGPITTVDAFLPRLGRRARIEIRIDAYHTAFLTRPKPQQAFDGYILAYSARRRASLAHLKALAHTAIPPSKRGSALLLVAVGEVTDFFNDHDTNALLTEGNELADKLRARFITVSPNADQQGGTYNAFFDELFEMKSRAPAPRPADDSEYATLSEMRSGMWDGQNGSPPPPPTADASAVACRHPLRSDERSPVDSRPTPPPPPSTTAATKWRHNPAMRPAPVVQRGSPDRSH